MCAVAVLSVQVPGTYMDAMSSQTKLGKAVKAAVEELEHLGNLVGASGTAAVPCRVFDSAAPQAAHVQGPAGEHLPVVGEFITCPHHHTKRLTQQLAVLQLVVLL